MKTFARPRFGQSRLYRLAREVKWAVENSRAPDDPLLTKVASLHPPSRSRGTVLLSRVNKAFFLKPGEAIPASHQNLWETHQMASIFLELGYSVDVIHYKNSQFVPRKDYSLFVDVKWNLPRIGPLLHKDCIRVLHIVMAHPLAHDLAEMRRLLAIQQRRGVTLMPRRAEWPNFGIEHADCATILGNQFTLDTYRYANKPIYRVPLAVPRVYPWVETKDYEACRRRFLWFASTGMVHKGLDLVLEAFAAMPEYELIVCGPVEKEQDFVAAYHRELYETKNIRVVGWVDVASPDFTQIANECIALIHPSCSEAGGGAVVTCLHAGLIPIASYESSVDVNPGWGIVLRTSSIDEIQESIQRIASLPIGRLKEMSRGAWEYARANHTAERFTEEYKSVISQIVTGHCRPAGQSAPADRRDSDARTGALVEG